MSLLLNWLESLTPDIKINDSCSRKKSLKSTCRKCVEICKLKAIEIVGKEIVVDSSMCNTCGECVIECPVSAIEGPYPFRHFENGMLLYDPSFIPSWKELLIHYKNGTNTILVDNVDLDEKWNEEIKKANSMLFFLGEAEFTIKNEMGVRKVTRRKFLRIVRNSSAVIAAEVIPEKWRYSSDDWDIAKRFTEYQFFYVRIERSKCTFCRTCSSLCSRNAIEMSSFEMSIKHSKCTNCGLCKEVCPESAISIFEEPSEKHDTKVSVVYKKCVSCKQDYYTFEKKENVCHFCKTTKKGWLSPNG